MTSGMVTAPHFLAARAGSAILRDGGNAVEAAVAMAATLAVVYPHMTGIGGDGFWLVSEPDGRIWSVQGCGGAAAKADLSLYAGLDTIPWRGPLAANTVAGTISSWAAALDRANTGHPLEAMLADAIRHAEEGVSVTAGGASIAAAKSDELRGQPGDYAATFEPASRPLRKGDLLRQPALATTLRALVEDGLNSFYRGSLAERIGADLAEMGSPLTTDDLAAHVASYPHPLRARIVGATLYNSAPPTQGFASLLILALFDQLQPAEAESFAHIHGIVEATKKAFLMRDRWIGDPDYMEVGLQAILSDADIPMDLARQIDFGRAMPWPQPSHPGDTCWFGAADARGQIVSCIQSTYFEFGSGLVLPRTGITWQNRGASFRLSGGGPNMLRPRAKPFHTLNPALARFADGRVMAYGTMGGEGQPQTQAAIFTRYARYGLGLAEAVAAPRWLLGKTWGEESVTLKIEDRFDPALYDQLRAAGHDVELVAPLTAMMGHAGAIVRYPDGALEGATDPRSDGSVETC